MNLIYKYDESDKVVFCSYLTDAEAAFYVKLSEAMDHYLLGGISLGYSDYNYDENFNYLQFEVRPITEGQYFTLQSLNVIGLDVFESLIWNLDDDLFYEKFGQFGIREVINNVPEMWDSIIDVIQKNGEHL